MQKLRLLSLASCALLAFVLGLFLVWPHGGHRNVFANPSLENLLTECSLAGDRGQLRLYQGPNEHGAGSPWWSVSYRAKDSSEMQIFYSFASPAIQELKCGEEVATLSFANGDVKNLQKIDFDRMSQAPVGFFRDELQAPIPRSSKRMPIFFGALILIVSIGMGFYVARHLGLRRRQSET